jgi:hypothetical protein
MDSLKLAITVVEAIIGGLVALAIGDYLGYKFGQKRVAGVLGVIALLVIIIFAIYAAIALASV